jgi:hypothetical protein
VAWPGRTRPAGASWAAHSASGSEGRGARDWRRSPDPPAAGGWRRGLGGGRWGRARAGGRSRGRGRAVAWSPRIAGPRRGPGRGPGRGRAPGLGRRAEPGRPPVGSQVRAPHYLPKVGGPGVPDPARAARGGDLSRAGRCSRGRRGRPARGAGTRTRRAERRGGQSRGHPGPRARPARGAGGRRAVEPGPTGRRTPRWRRPGRPVAGHRRRVRRRRARGGIREPGCPPRSSPPFRPRQRCILAQKGRQRLILAHPGSVGADTRVWATDGQSRRGQRPGTGGRATADRRRRATFSQALSWLVHHARASPGYSQAVYRRMRRPPADAARCARTISDSTDLTVRAARAG